MIRTRRPWPPRPWNLLRTRQSRPKVRLEEALKRGRSEKSPDAAGRLDDLRRADTHLAAVTAGLEELRVRSDTQPNPADREGQASSVPVRNPGRITPAVQVKTRRPSHSPVPQGETRTRKPQSGHRREIPLARGPAKRTKRWVRTWTIPSAKRGAVTHGESFPAASVPRSSRRPLAGIVKSTPIRFRRYYRAIARVRQSLDGPTQTAVPKLSPR